ncbi:MAG: hypothetical protein VW397_00640 [Candidatus Margulisiibacteriota bacterium]
MNRYVFLVFLTLLISCGKVAQDISDQSNKSIFKSVSLSTDYLPFSVHGWSSVPTTQNVIDVYVYGQGVTYGKGYEKIGFARAVIGLEGTKKASSPVVTNYDLKKNLVTSSRYQQGYIQFNLLPSDNYKIKTVFKKVRPKYDFYSFFQYTSKDQYILTILSELPTTNIEITPYQHLVSVLFYNHLKKESFNQESIIPLKEFYRIIPTASVTASTNIMVKNSVKKFKYNDPLFSISSPYLDALLTIVNIAYYSDQFDVQDYLSSLDPVIISDVDKAKLKMSLKTYFKDKSVINGAVTPNVLAPND